MKKYLSLLLMMLFMPLAMIAEEITIGTGTGYGSNVPLSNGFKYAWVETIYPKSSFEGESVITKIAYQVKMAISTSTFQKLKIYMGETDNVNHAGSMYQSNAWTPMSDLTLVYDHTDVPFGRVAGWDELVLDTPFAYSATKNLVVVVAHECSDTFNVSTFFNTSSTKASLYRRSDTDANYMNHPGTVNGTYVSNYANIRLTLAEASCKKVTSIMVGDVTSTSASINWAYETGDTWDVYITDNGVAPTAETTPTATVSTAMYNFTGLTPSTGYNAYVRTNCGAGDVSAWMEASVYTSPDFLGDGTAENPYKIYTVSDMGMLSQAVAGGWNTKGFHFQLQNDLTTVETPVGVESNGFRGEFDGNEYSITVNIVAAAGEGYKALFAVAASGAEIHDLTVKGNVQAKGAYSAGIVARVIALDGDATDVVITNCHNQAEVNSTSNYVGGVVGGNYGTMSSDESHLIINNCTNKGNVTTTGDNCGGLIGYLGGYCVVDNSVNFGAVTGNNRYVGGIAGYCYTNGEIMNCANKGAVAAPGTPASYDYNYAGGIVGCNNAGYVRNCYNLGSVSGAVGNIGGIVGSNSFLGTNGLVANVYNAGEVTAPSSLSSAYPFAGCSGGAIVGYNAGFTGYGSAKVEYAYYKNGTFANAFGENSFLDAVASVTSFTQAGTSCTLAETVYATTDLKTALNSWTETTTDFAVWYDDIYGNNQSLPTFNIGTVPGLYVTPEPLAFGTCPIAAWTEPRAITLNNTGSNDITITGFDYTNLNWFTLSEEPELPMLINAGESTNLYLTTNSSISETEPGVINNHLVIFWNGRNATIVNLSATAYTPVSPDVYELAQVVEGNGTINQDAANLYNNYRLPGSNVDGPDAVYKLTYTADVIFNAAMIAGNSGKIALYAEDFNGFGGPSVDNYYVGANPEDGSVSFGGDAAIANLSLRPGTYYLVASSTSPTFSIEIDAQAAPAPIKPELVAPAFGEHGITSPVELQWQLGQYTAEYRVLFGMEFPPVNVLIDWTDELAESTVVETVANNRNYFWRVEARNGSGTVQGDIWAFTTSLNIPQNLTANDETIYVNDDLTLSWNAIVDRGYRGYNIYQDSVKVNATPITDTHYTFRVRNYNMEGLMFNVTAVYDEGESEFSNGVTVQVSGDGNITGTVYELDGTTPISGAYVVIEGIDEFGTERQYRATTNANGVYNANVKVSAAYQVSVSAIGYQDAAYDGTVAVVNAETTSGIDVILTEVFKPVLDVVAEAVPDDEDKVHIYWGYGHLTHMIEDFETGDFSQFNWNNESTYPWEITSAQTYEGTYAMKSGNKTVSNSTSSIEVTVDLPHAGKMSFYYMISCEATYDRGFFYIDGAQMDVWSGVSEWSRREYGVSEGTHTFKWAYEKDGTYNEEDDCLYVDYINFIYDAPPAHDGWLSYDDGTYHRSQGAGANADRAYYWGIKIPTNDLVDYNGYTLDKVACFDHSAGQYTMNIYMGGVTQDNGSVALTSTAELLATKVVTFTGMDDMREIELDEPIAIDPFRDLWITFGTDGVAWPAAGSRNTGNANGRWTSLSNNLWWDITHWAIYDITWMIRGYVSSGDGRTAVFNEFDMNSDITFEGFGGSEDEVMNSSIAETPITVGVPTVANEEQDRSFQYYQIFMCPRGEENTDNMIATGITDTTYVWDGWANVETGVYKFGVRSYFEGNRGYSPVVWSNTMPRNMFTTVDITATTNSGDNVRGAVVKLHNISEPELGLTYETVLDATGTYEWESFRKGTYVANLTLNGFESCYNDTEIEISDATSLECMLTEIISSDTTLFVSSTGWAKWTPIVTEEPEADMLEDFETGNLTKFAWDNTLSVFPWVISNENPYEGRYCLKSSNSGVPSSQSVIEVTVDIPTSGTMSFYAQVLGEVYAGGAHYDYGMFYIDGSSAGDLFTETVWTRKTYHISAGIHTFKWVYKKDSSVNPQGDFLAIDKIQFVTPAKDGRSIESYDIQLDGTLVATVSVPYYQHDVTDMLPGEVHTTSIINNYTTGSSEPNSYTWIYTPCDEFVGITNLAVEAQARNAYLTWTNPSNIGMGDEFSYNFESGDLEGWTNIDADGDGNAWYNTATATDEPEGHDSYYCVVSNSYDMDHNVALHPDNYLVSPRVHIGFRSYLTFYASALDDEYNHEHFGVAVSTSGNVDAADFTTIAEWDSDAKIVSRKGDRNTWKQYTIDLAQFAGYDCYIAFRHFDCSDNFVIGIDDVVLGNHAKSRSEVLFDQAQFVTNPGALNGHDVSALQGEQNQLGPNANYSMPCYVADDFTLETESTINEIEVYGYQTGSTTNSTFTGLHFAIYDASPMEGGHVIAGDMTQNAITATEWTQCYRTGTDLTGQTRPIMSVTATDLNITLPAGQYWLVWGMEGTMSSGPWAMPRTIAGEVNTGNGLNYTSEWKALVDDGSNQPYGLAFKISGVEGNGNTEASGEYLGAYVFRDGELLTEEPIKEEHYTDVALEEGDYNYSVRIVYGDSNFGEYDPIWYSMSCPEEVEIHFDMVCDAPKDLYGEYDAENQTVTMTWPYHEIIPINEWLHYDNGLNFSAIGTGDGLYWGIMFPTDMLQDYAGTYLTKVMIYDYEAAEVTVTISYGGSDAPLIPVHSQSFQLVGKLGWQEVELTTPIPVNEALNLWVTCHSESTGNPAAICQNTGDPNGRWVSHDGHQWIDIATEGMLYSWMLRAFVTEEMDGGAKASRSLEQFNIYRGSNNVSYELIASVPAGDLDQWTYTDAPGEGTWYYQVRAYYVGNDHDCESEPATLYEDHTQDYLVVTITDIDENHKVALYPNPTNGNVTINAQNMNHITVVSVLGQVVYDAEVDGSEIVLNMGQFNAGVYTVRIATENGVSTQRVTVVK